MHRHDHGLRFATSVQLPLIDTGRIRLSVYGRRSRSAAMWLIGGPDSPKHIIGPQWALAPRRWATDRKLNLCHQPAWPFPRSKWNEISSSSSDLSRKVAKSLNDVPAYIDYTHSSGRVVDRWCRRHRVYHCSLASSLLQSACVWDATFHVPIPWHHFCHFSPHSCLSATVVVVNDIETFLMVQKISYRSEWLCGDDDGTNLIANLWVCLLCTAC